MNTEEIEVESDVVDSAADTTLEGEQIRFAQTAVQAIKKGSLAAREAAITVAVSPVKWVNHAVYGACYGLAYGTVYSALLVSRVFPEGGVIRKGLHEGLESAVKDFDAKQQEQAMVATDATMSA